MTYSPLRPPATSNSPLDTTRGLTLPGSTNTTTSKMDEYLFALALGETTLSYEDWLKGGKSDEDDSTTGGYSKKDGFWYEKDVMGNWVKNPLKYDPSQIIKEDGSTPGGSSGILNQAEMIAKYGSNAVMLWQKYLSDGGKKFTNIDAWISAMSPLTDDILPGSNPGATGESGWGPDGFWYDFINGEYKKNFLKYDRTKDQSIVNNSADNDAAAQRQAEMIAWYREQQQNELAMQKQEKLAQLRANPASWLQYNSLSGETPQIQPWMLPLQMGDYGWQTGQDIPGWDPQSESLQGKLPSLLNPSAQFLKRSGPDMYGQYQSYQQANTGASPDTTNWLVDSRRAPAGQNTGLNWMR